MKIPYKAAEVKLALPLTLIRDLVDAKELRIKFYQLIFDKADNNDNSL